MSKTNHHYGSAAASAKAWPFELARAIAKRPDRQSVLFATGYGPSGLPHIGTFGEIARTCMVRQAFRTLTEDQIPTRLICVSDDMDGLRSIPDKVPNREALSQHLQKPLIDIPDPFGTHSSFGAHMNARLCAFLDRFGFDYEFISSAELYKSGYYDAMLLRVLERHDQIMAVMLPSLGEERRQSYSPFLPISPNTGRVLYVPLTATDPKAGTISFVDSDGQEVSMKVTGGGVKLQWKPDFAMRWAALGVDFEMFGKDHQANAPLYSKICRILGGEPPVQFIYELFLDEHGEKISKSRGNGVSMDEWLSYAPSGALSLFQYSKPRAAKRLYPGVIPRITDEYLAHLRDWKSQNEAQRLENPVWHIHQGNPPQQEIPVSYSMLLNLCIAANASDADILWKFLQNYAPGLERNELLEQMIENALAYHEQQIKPQLHPRAATAKEREALKDLASQLDKISGASDPESLQSMVFAVGRQHNFEPLRDWFKAIYEILFGTSSGPRFGSFIAIYGTTGTAGLIRERLDA